MKNFPKVILALAILIFFTSCRRDEGYLITGEVSGFPDSTKLYLRNLATDAVFDSTLITDNTFRFKGQLHSPPEQIWLMANIDQKHVYANLLIGNEKVHIKGDLADFPWKVQITGSKSQDDYNDLLHLTKDYDIKRDSLLQTYFLLSPEAQEAEGKLIWEELAAIDKITKSKRIEYIKVHPDTYASIIHLGYLKNALPRDTVRALFQKYPAKIRNSKYASIVEVFLKAPVATVGDHYYDFEGINQKDQSVTFSEIRGEYTLIDFTSAYCGPCILAADELQEINRSYADSLKIVSFSGDPKKEDWLKSLKRDGVTWDSVWDGKGRYSETSIKYGVTGYPAFVLVSPEGIIMDKWGGYAEGSLKERLAGQLSN